MAVRVGSLGSVAVRFCTVSMGIMLMMTGAPAFAVAS